MNILFNTLKTRDNVLLGMMQTLKQGVKIDPWAVAVFDGRCHDGEQVARQLLESCTKRGMKMREAAVVEKEPQNAQNYPPEQRVERMITALRPYKPAFILVILPDKDSPIYGKHWFSKFPCC